MMDGMRKLIQDIDKLDSYRRTIMEELKHLQDITLYYDRLHPELHGKTSTGQHTRDTRVDNERGRCPKRLKEEHRWLTGDTLIIKIRLIQMPTDVPIT